jgi:hypothetical protein
MGTRNIGFVIQAFALTTPSSPRRGGIVRMHDRRGSVQGSVVKKKTLSQSSQRFFASYWLGRIPAVLPARFTRRRGDDGVDGFAPTSYRLRSRPSEHCDSCVSGESGSRFMFWARLETRRLGRDPGSAQLCFSSLLASPRKRSGPGTHSCGAGDHVQRVSSAMCFS